MSEIEKMYLLAGIKKGRMSDEDCVEDCLDYECKNCRYSSYPPFTAEKQLKILCFIVNKKHSVTFHDYVFDGDKLTLEKIQENLAWAINRIWKDLTEEECKQIKEILS